MNDGDSFLQDLTGQIVDLAGDYIASGGLRVSVKTNLGPEIPIGSAGGGAGGITDLLGIKAAVIVRKRDGSVVQTIGNPPATDPLRLGVVIVLVTLLGTVLVRGVLPR